MKEYELVFVTKQSSEGDNLKKEILEELKSTIEGEKGKLGEVQEWGKRDLAYPIKKEKSGNFTIVGFQAPGAVPNTLNSKLKLMEDLLRFMLVIKEKTKVEK